MESIFQNSIVWLHMKLRFRIRDLIPWNWTITKNSLFQLGMATGRVRGGCSFSGPEPETRTKNPTRTRTPWWGKIRPRTRTRWGPENRRGPVNRVMQTQIAVQRIQKYKQQSTDCYLSIYNELMTYNYNHSIGVCFYKTCECLCKQHTTVQHRHTTY
jgi:hypothetical protein